jgi:hypothetical protein
LTFSPSPLVSFKIGAAGTGSSLTGFYNGSRGGRGSSGGGAGVLSLTFGKSGLPAGFLVAILPLPSSSLTGGLLSYVTASLSYAYGLSFSVGASLVTGLTTSGNSLSSNYINYKV